MIFSYGNAETKKFALGLMRVPPEIKKTFKSVDVTTARKRFAILEAAESLSDFPALKSINLHKLSGNLKDFWAINVNDGWRIIFKFEGNKAEEVTLVDYHKG